MNPAGTGNEPHEEEEEENEENQGADKTSRERGYRKPVSLGKWWKG